MKSLLLIRHARAGWSQNQTDQERALNERGRLEARQMGQRLKDRNFSPQTIVSSPALRARETSELIASMLEFDIGRIALIDDLYLAGPDTLLTIIGHHAASGNLMLVGHNPGMTELINRLAAGRIDRLPTASCALFKINDTKITNDRYYGGLIDFPANPGEPLEV